MKSIKKLLVKMIHQKGHLNESLDKIVGIVVIPHQINSTFQEGEYGRSTQQPEKNEHVGSEEWSLIKVTDEAGNYKTLPALVFSEKESQDLQNILSKYNI